MLSRRVGPSQSLTHLLQYSIIIDNHDHAVVMLDEELYLIEKWSILQVLNVLSLKKDWYTVSFWKIADVRPPERSDLCSFLKKF